MRQMLVALLIGVMTYPAPAFAIEKIATRPLTAGSASQVNETLVKAGIERNSKVAVTLRDKSVITGRLDDVGTHSLFVIDSTTGLVTQVPYRNISQLQVWSPSLKTKIIVLSVLAAVIVFLLVVVKEV